MTKKASKPAKSKSLKRPKAVKPASQTAPTKKSNPPKPLAKAYIIFGADEYAKPRAARLTGEEPELLAKAAEAMHLRLVEVTGEELAEIAKRLPAGRLHASGRGLVPYIKGELYSELLSATATDQPTQHGPEPTAQELPRSWDEVAPGHVVIARETLECGWWEAVVVERNGDLVILRYRDYPQYSPLVRHRSVVALISAAPPAA
jgi:hypothetical protein